MFWGKKKIVVVDDEENILLTVSRMLEAFGYKVYTAHTGNEAIALAESVKPDLILLDLILPDLDGMSVYLHLKKDVQTKNIPIVFMTAKTDTQIKLQSGGRSDLLYCHYLRKPFRKLELLRMVERNLKYRTRFT